MARGWDSISSCIPASSAFNKKTRRRWITPHSDQRLSYAWSYSYPKDYISCNAYVHGHGLRQDGDFTYSYEMACVLNMLLFNAFDIFSYSSQFLPSNSKMSISATNSGWALRSQSCSSVGSETCWPTFDGFSSCCPMGTYVYLRLPLHLSSALIHSQSPFWRSFNHLVHQDTNQQYCLLPNRYAIFNCPLIVGPHVETNGRN